MQAKNIPVGFKCNNLTVLKREKYGKGNYRYLCECSDCGSFAYSLANKLENGQRKCKCIKKPIKSKDRFYMLEAIERNHSMNGRVYWKFRCDCGNIIIREASKVTYNNKIGIRQNCGCYSRIIHKENGRKTRKPPGYSCINKIISSYKFNAKKRNLTFNLTRDDCIELFKNRCHYCNTLPYKIFKHKSCYDEIVYNGIDRIDSGIGYEKMNVVSCCEECNYKKRNTSYDVFLRWIAAVYNNLCTGN